MKTKRLFYNIFIILIQGGLGNQMFCYSFYLSIKKRYPKALIFLKISPFVNQHHGLEIFRIFNIKGKWRYRFCKPWFFWKWFHTIKQTNALAYEPDTMKTTHQLSYFEGHWQSEKYFKSIEETIRKQFQFKQSSLNKETLQLSEEIKNTNSVSIHIRRGDYLNFPQCAVCDIEYYRKAIDYIKGKIIEPTFFIFSDDIDWCKQNLQIKNSFFVNFNQGNDSWQDMYLMSQCKHNIIANSTFSWWGAWLNDNPDKIVISPHQWFKNDATGDIIPDNWIKNK